MVRILGIDPGSLKTGFGIISTQGGHSTYVGSGLIRLPAVSLPERLGIIFRSLQAIILEYQPEIVAVEQVFLAKSASSALKLGQARGAAIVAAAIRDLPVYEYETRKVKQSVVGTGAADKRQVQHMVQRLLNLDAAPSEDAADALAVALCHAHSQQQLASLARAQAGWRRGRIIE